MEREKVLLSKRTNYKGYLFQVSNGDVEMWGGKYTRQLTKQRSYIMHMNFMPIWDIVTLFFFLT